MLAPETLWSTFLNVNLKNLFQPVLDGSLLYLFLKQYFIVTPVVCGLVITLFEKSKFSDLPLAFWMCMGSF